MKKISIKARNLMLGVMSLAVSGLVLIDKSAWENTTWTVEQHKCGQLIPL